MKSHEETMRMMREATEKQRLDLPDNWRTTIKKVSRNCYVSDVKDAFGVSISTLLRWRRKDKEFDEQVTLRMKFAPGKKPKKAKSKKQEIDIENLLIDLRLSELNAPAKERRVFVEAQAAIKQLRQQLRAAQSETQRIREAAHFRAAGNASRPHATAGNGVHTVVPDIGI